MEERNHGCTQRENGDGEEERRGASLKDALARCLRGRGVRELEELEELRSLGWSQRKLDACFGQERKSITARQWLGRHAAVLAAVEARVRVVPRGGRCAFLDVGGSPGGFAAYVLHRNRGATGVGMAGPEAQAQVQLNAKLQRRFRVLAGDVAMLRLHPPTRETAAATRGLKNMPDEFRDRDLVLLDARPLVSAMVSGRQGASGGHGDGPAAHRLLVAQLVIALRGLKRGGTLVVTLDHAERLATAQVLFLLKGLCAEVVAVKPAGTLQIHSRFVAVGRAFGHGPRGGERAGLLRGLERLWFELTLGGPGGGGRGLVDGDLDFVVSCEEIVRGRVGELVELAAGVWKTQAEGLREWFCSHGVLGGCSVSARPLTASRTQCGDAEMVVKAVENIPGECGDEESVQEMAQDTGQDTETAEDPSWVLL